MAGDFKIGDDHRRRTTDQLDLLRQANDGRVAWVGPSARAPAADRVVDVFGRAVVPGFVDSHSHLVYAGDRASEFTARMAGVPYDGGGIGVSVAATRAATDDELRGLLRARVAEMRALYDDMNVATDGSLHIDSEYLVSVIRR